jgi:phage protein U
MIGYFGDIIFETSDRRILSFVDFSIETSARFETHNLIGTKPKTEYVGPGLLSVSFTIIINGNHGVKPREEMERWLELAESGEPQILVLAGKPIGENRWVVRSVSQAWDVIFAGGELFSGKIDVTLEEYAG